MIQEQEVVEITALDFNIVINKSFHESLHKIEISLERWEKQAFW